MQKAINSLKETPRLEIEEPIYYPGELEIITREQRLQNGIPVPMTLVETITIYFGENLINLKKLGNLENLEKLSSL